MARQVLLASASPPAILSRSGLTPPIRPERDRAYDGDGDDRDEGQFDGNMLTQLCEWFEASEDQSQTNRDKAERDVDYYDGKQLTEDEARELRRRGQPPVVKNRIRRKIDFLQGLERQQRTDPRALPVDPSHEEDAHAATDALRAVCQGNAYDQIRSKVWADDLKVGWGGVEVVAEPRPNSQNPHIVIRQNHWDRMFVDPYSVEEDYSDANYLGQVRWMDQTQAVLEYGRAAADVFSETLSSVSAGSTYDDRPKETTWVDHSRRKRIRVVQMYFKNADGVWCFSEFTKGGFLRAAESPWLDDDGEPEHPFVWVSCYIDRDNNRYGIIRDMIDVQDAINKRESKLLHLVSVRQTFGVEGALGRMTTRQLRQELAKPDGHVGLAPGIEFGKQFGVIPTADMAQGQMELLKLDMNEMDLLGPNASMQGKGPQDQSGRAILAQQQGGQMEIGPQLDGLRAFDVRVYEKVWRRIRQYWTAEEWVRITDDQKNVKFVGLNVYKRAPVVDTMTGQPVLDPQTGQPATRVVTDLQGQPVVEKNDVGKLGVDISIEDAPKMGQLRAESFQTLAGMVKFVPELQEMPAKTWVRLSGIDTAAEVLNTLDDMEQAKQQQAANPQAQAAQQLQMQGAQAEIANKVADSKSKEASAIHKVAQAKNLDVETAATVMRAAHEHSDHLVTAAHGGLPPEHFIPAAQPPQPDNVVPFQGQ